MIAGLSESAIRRHISEATSTSLAQMTDRQQAAVNLQHELNNAAPSRDTSVAEVTSTGTNTTLDIVLTEDQATETGWYFFDCWVCFFFYYKHCMKYAEHTVPYLKLHFGCLTHSCLFVDKYIK